MAAIEAALPKIVPLIAMLDDRLGGREYLAGDELTFADILLMVTVRVPQAFPEGARMIVEAPCLKRYIEPHSSRPSFVSTQA